ncbi:1750_t:CDS:10 [Ambispora leptoticha]|uniref:1750_t:CDS:1 n=1 Tax=Ambispora leptoticha TaxID=144679 RepID=A0A9N8Z1X8_9GLOM|nr:1750_t:CDS:10 [Ambispora leptoticha]
MAPSKKQDNNKAKKIGKADWKEGFKKKQVGVSDMTMLSKVNNEAINENLKKRFGNGEIYTYIGHVLISVNPFKDLGIYTDEVLHSYTGKNRLEMPPHVYAVAESAYYNMNSYKENQCIIISGESGAGKTEAAKRIMQYIATVSGGSGTSSIQEIKNMVLATNPLLESFGCAKTLRNNNSSRHGKYLEIQFNYQAEPVGAKITNYLLEKGRVVGQIENERNFHIFYQFTKARPAEYEEQFYLQGPESYLYTSRSGCLDVDGIDDMQDFSDTINAMNVIGISKGEQDDIFRMLAIILWLGNVQFEEDDNGNAYISDEDVTNLISVIMEVEHENLMKVLTSRVIETQRGGRRGSVINVLLNPVQASAVRDALSKAIYNNLFEWIVERINSAMQERHESSYLIGVLDIYGFEIFDENSFEQLCINYVNEKLQQIFIELTLKTEQEEYVREKIKWTPINFFNNKVVCDLIEEKRPPGIFAALNDACATAHADSEAADSSFVQRLGSLSSNPHFETRGSKFLVKHYAGEVLYNISGMTDKNKDQLVKDMLELVASSNNDFLQQLFPHQVDRDSKKRPPTASDKIKAFIDFLNMLIDKYNPSEYDEKMVLHQIKYLGLNENIRVRRAGFAYRQTFEKFLERFYLLSGKTSYAGEYIWQGDPNSGTERILKDTGIDTEEWQMGVTKVFIRHPETIWALEHLRDRYWHNMAMRIQRAYRNYVRYKHECARRIQRCWKKNKDQIVYVQLRDYGHQVLAGRKERRRFSLISMRKFMGDYLGVASQSGEALRNVCNIGVNEIVAFSSKIQLLVSRLGRSSKPSPRQLVLTEKNIYIVISTLEKQLLKMNVERMIPLNTITGIGLSNLRDDWVVLHLNNPTKELGDPIFSCYFKTEFVVHLLQRTAQARITVKIENQIEFTKKLNKTAQIKFVKDETIKKDDVYKSHTVSVPSGEPPNTGNPTKPKAPTINRPPSIVESVKPARSPSTRSSVNIKSPNSQVQSPPGRLPPPPPPKTPPPPPKPAHPTFKAIYDFNSTDSGELSFVKDDILQIVEKDDNGWWLAKKDGKQGWVPSNYLEEIVEQTPPPPPTLPSRRPLPPITPTEDTRATSPEIVDDDNDDDNNTREEPKSLIKEKKGISVLPGLTQSSTAAGGGVPAWKLELEARKSAKQSSEESSSAITTIASGRKIPPPVKNTNATRKAPVVAPKPTILPKVSSASSSNDESSRSVPIQKRNSLSRSTAAVKKDKKGTTLFRDIAPSKKQDNNKAKKIGKADWKEGFKKKQVGVSDMTMLSKVNNEAINENLKKRFGNGEIYTYIGHVLISVNPFKDLGIYTDEVLHSYTGKNRLEMPPHVYAVAESAYYNMNSYKENQCIIISGESGAGKTEAAKRIMQYIATVSGGSGTSSIQEIKNMVLATNPLLESFGCAKTLRNNNSSRHGKYLEIQFNYQAEPVGAKITNYLLEKGRVVGQIENERNFHIFYQFTKARPAEYEEQFYLQGPESYLYTSRSGCLDVDGIDDMQDFSDTINAMNVIGISKGEQDDIFRMLAIILWLGNVQFEEDDNGNAYISDEDVTNLISVIMEVEHENLMKVLTSRVIETQRGGRRGSVINVLLNPVQASAVRDALSKAIYNNLFEWIVERINSAMQERHESSYLIGVLDIYGFEIFDENSFEQLCINYVNEKLQQIFIELTLKTEQEEYVREKIKWTPINFFNNKVVCDLIEEKRPPGIFAALNDACATAHADSEAADSSFVQRLGSLSSNPHFETRGSKFLVKHYAGEVLYNISGMTDKNKDQLVKDMLELVASSNNDFLQQLFPHQVDRDSKKRPPTASDKIKAFIDFLNMLIDKYNPSEYDEKMVLHQIKYLGLNENIRVRRAGFAYRQTFEKFLERFYLLSGKTSYAGEYIWQGDPNSGTERILKDTGIDTEEWQMGVTKVFIRHPETIWALEHLRDRYWHNMAMRIQRAYRNYVRYKHECARRIQRCWKKNKDQIVYVQLRDYGHQVLAGRKERRRFSLISMRKFMGDYLGVASQSGEALRNVCNIGVNEIVAFSSKIQLLVSRLGRSSKPSPRQLVLTEKNIYIVISTLEKQLLKMNVERMIPLNTITGIGLSNLRDDWVVLHLNNPTKELGDPIFSCYFKTEFVVHLLQRTAQARITVKIENQIEFTKKLNKTAQIKFVKDETIKKDDVYKSHTVSVPSGEPPNTGNPTKPKAPTINRPPSIVESVKPARSPSTRSSVNIKSPNSQVQSPPGRLPPPPPPKTPPPPPKPAHPTFKAIYDFNSTDSGELSFVKDDILQIVEKDDNGWWLAKKDGKQGWVPSNYLEEIVEQTPPPPPTLPSRRPLPPITPTEDTRATSPEIVDDDNDDDNNTREEPKSLIKEKKGISVLPGLTQSSTAAGGGVPAWKLELEARKSAKQSSEESSSAITTIASGRKIPPPVKNTNATRKAPVVAPKPTILPKVSSASSSNDESSRSVPIQKRNSLSRSTAAVNLAEVVRYFFTCKLFVF